MPLLVRLTGGIAEHDALVLIVNFISLLVTQPSSRRSMEQDRALQPVFIAGNLGCQPRSSLHFAAVRAREISLLMFRLWVKPDRRWAFGSA